MDTSKEYIKMCDCPEIQDSHKYIDGDFIGDFTWLPRQDQIQEMMPSENKDYPLCCYCFIDALFEFSRSDNCKIHVGSSMEQLWLAFYVFEKHARIWDGEKWVVGK